MTNHDAPAGTRNTRQVVNMPCANGCTDSNGGQRVLSQDVTYDSNGSSATRCVASLPPTAPTLPKCQAFTYTGHKKRSTCWEDTCYIGAQLTPTGPELWLPGCRDGTNLAGMPTADCGAG